MRDDPHPTPPEGLRRVHLDAPQLKVLAHPLRARLLGALRLQGPATATVLAQRLGTNSGTTSYHLRKLGEVGLVEDAPDQGDGRDRWWRAVHDMSSWSEGRFLEDPDTAAAADWLAGYALRSSTRRAEDWLEARHEWPREWVDASTISDYEVRLPAARLRELMAELFAVVERYKADADPGAAGAELVGIFLQAFPMVRDGS